VRSINRLDRLMSSSFSGNDRKWEWEDLQKPRRMQVRFASAGGTQDTQGWQRTDSSPLPRNRSGLGAFPASFARSVRRR
jgi:hypothetical protein